ncbi:uncharacterized protein LOC106161210 [Lingula anatina]|uniref:Uncharacterized protein LOC106161210 n=1 Tax=Lingula anatina TaxID=7574 RepID=A0A1S3I5I8_LINAN|nr:uncharacterized protein LOC106161210 [Lingula anatina]|eukprot:XP_013393545.1 uncharacterized protein LOC106161210 [Lingula anatina]
MPNRRNQRGTFKNTDKHPARRHDSPQDDSISQVVLYDKNSTRKTGDPYSYSESYQDSSVTVPDERWLAGRKREKYRGGDHRPLERPLITGATSDDLDSSNSYSYESSRDRGRQVKVVTSPGRKTEIPMAKMRQKHERHKDYHRRLTESALAQHRNKHGYPSGRYPRNDAYNH